MKSWKRLFYYLMLNVLVSACTTFAVLYAWDRTQNPLPGGLLPFASSSSEPAEEIQSAPETANPEPGATPTPIFIVYQVQAGDDFSSIAAKFDVDEALLISVNGFTQSQALGAGEVLRIPVIPPTPIPAEKPEISIVSVIGAGDLDSERVVLRQVGEGSLMLAGWQLVDEDGFAYTLPFLEVVNDGYQVDVFTKAGASSVDKLYWGLDRPVWETGETVRLLDEQGEVRATLVVQ